MHAQTVCHRPPLLRRSLFEVPVRMRDGRITNLRISLPPNFPAGRPGLAVRPSPVSAASSPHHLLGTGLME
jgi:hypothetical protein